MKKINKKLILNIIWIIGLLFYVVLFISILSLDLLPGKYLLMLVLLLIFIEVLSFVFINLKNKIVKIIGTVILVIGIVVSIFGIYYVNKTNSFFNQKFSSNTKAEYTYYIVTSTKSKMEENDIKGDIYYYNNFNISMVKKYLKDKFSLNYHESSSLSTLFNDVKDGKIDFMLIDKSSYNLVFEIDKTLSSSDYDILYKFDITRDTKIKSSTTKSVFTLFICGTDFAGFNDLNLLVTVNLNTNKVLITTIPRAYYIEVDGKDGRKDTLSFMSPYGINTSIKSIENYFNIDIDYYLKINTHSLVSLVDEIGGITYCSDQAYYTTHSLVLDTYEDTKAKFYVKKGCQELNGIETLTVARERLAFYDGDRTRQKNCVKIMQAIFDRMIALNTLTNYNNILNSLASLYETDMPKDEISLIVKKILESDTKMKVETQSVDGYETMDYVHLTDYKDYVIYPIESTVIDATGNIKKLLSETN